MSDVNQGGKKISVLESVDALIGFGAGYTDNTDKHRLQIDYALMVEW